MADNCKEKSLFLPKRDRTVPDVPAFLIRTFARMALRRLILQFAAAAVLAAGLASCGTSRKATATGSYRGSTGRTERPSPPPQHLDLSGEMAAPTGALLREADSWIGTAYVYGGNDRSGVDCSGFVMKVFENALDIRLPRTSRQQQEFCKPIDRSELREGDLVFFTVRGGSTVGHVGIYVGNDMMIHASSSRGVILTSISGKYYIDNFYSAGRVEKYFAMLDGGRLSMPESKTAAAAPKPDMATAATKPQQPASTPPQKPMKTIRFGAPGPTASGTAPTATQSVAPTDGSEEESALEELSEFFD